MREQAGDTDVMTQANNLLILGRVLIKLSDHVGAKDNLNRALALYGQLGTTRGQAHCYSLLSMVCMASSQLQDAKDCLDKAKALYATSGTTPSTGYARALLLVARQYAQSNNPSFDVAKDLLHRALAVCREHSELGGMYEAYVDLGELHCRLSEWDEAEKHFLSALELATEQSWERRCKRVSELLRDVYTNSNQPENAAKYATQAEDA